MHESSLARQLLSVVIERAASQGATRVLAVRGWVADAEELSAESLAWQFGRHAAGTIADGARVDIVVKPVSARCTRCGATYRPDHHLTLCPRCGSVEAEMLGETGLGIDAIDIDAGDGA
jgi:hydrogenase nickel incorporation protein HypA/HybF